MGWGVNARPQLLYPVRDSVPIAQEVGWVSGSVWTGAEIVSPTGIRSQNFQYVVSHHTDCSVTSHPNLQKLNKTGKVHVT